MTSLCVLTYGLEGWAEGASSRDTVREYSTGSSEGRAAIFEARQRAGAVPQWLTVMMFLPSSAARSEALKSFF